MGIGKSFRMIAMAPVYRVMCPECDAPAAVASACAEVVHCYRCKYFDSLGKNWIPLSAERGSILDALALLAAERVDAVECGKSVLDIGPVDVWERRP